MSNLTGRVAIVTGASKGIGAAIAKGMAAAGAAVVVNYASSKDAADRVVAEIASTSGKAIAVQADVSKPADVRRLFEETRRAFQTLDVLVNNAGVYQFGPLEAVTEDAFHRHFDINVLGPLLMIQEAVKQFGPDGGSIINIGSIGSTTPIPQSLIYAASKGAVDTLTRVLAAELGPRKIRVNTLAPGGVDTEGLRQAGVGVEVQQQIATQVPLGRFGRPDDIAGVAVFLASADAQWVTGERITVSGGWR